jgi:anti-anti-sigma factor
MDDAGDWPRGYGRCEAQLVDRPEGDMPKNRTPDITSQSGVTVIALGPEYESLDEQGLDELRGVILDVARSADPPLVVLDLSHTKFFGSAFIEIMFRAWNRLRTREGGEFCLSGLTPYCREVIDVTHLDRVWHVCDTREEGVRLLLER